MRSSSASSGSPWLLPYALLCGGSVALAMLLTFAHSLGVLAWPPSRAIDFSAWRALLDHGPFWRSLAFSVTLTAVSLVVAVALALALLAGLGARLRRGWLARVLLLPLAVPPVVAALMAFVLLGDSGWLSRLAHHLGWTALPADFPSLVFDRAGRGILITHVVMVTPLLVLLFDHLASHLRLPALLQQGVALGASRWQAWRRIALPLLLGHARPVLTVYALALLGAYEVPLLLGAAQPSMLAVTIQRAVAGLDPAQRPLGYAMASLCLLLCVAAWALLEWRATPRTERGA